MAVELSDTNQSHSDSTEYYSVTENEEKDLLCDAQETSETQEQVPLCVDTQKDDTVVYVPSSSEYFESSQSSASSADEVCTPRVSKRRKVATEKPQTCSGSVEFSSASPEIQENESQLQQLVTNFLAASFSGTTLEDASMLTLQTEKVLASYKEKGEFATPSVELMTKLSLMHSEV